MQGENPIVEVVLLPNVKIPEEWGKFPASAGFFYRRVTFRTPNGKLVDLVGKSEDVISPIFIFWHKLEDVIKFLKQAGAPPVKTKYIKDLHEIGLVGWK